MVFPSRSREVAMTHEKSEKGMVLTFIATLPLREVKPALTYYYKRGRLLPHHYTKFQQFLAERS